jgi:hypothetical protein
MRKLLLVSLLMLSSSKLFAEDNSVTTSVQENADQENVVITEEQVRASIDLLIRAGILEYKDGHLQEKKDLVKETPTEFLSNCGRVRKQNNNTSSICLRAECI